jgi:hypothetical protein
MPPYYVSLVYSPSYGFAAPGPVVVRSTATGRVLTTVAPPRGEEFTGVSGAADDTTFVLAAETPGQVARRMRDRTWARGLLADAMPDRFYLLRFDAITDTVRVTPLPIPTLPHASDFALSPDGTSLAVASATVSKITVSVYPLTAGPVHTWTEGTHQGGQYRWLAAWGLSWIQGSQLAFTLGPQAAKGQPTIGWLNTAASGGNLLSDSYVFPPGPCAGVRDQPRPGPGDRAAPGRAVRRRYRLGPVGAVDQPGRPDHRPDRRQRSLGSRHGSAGRS